MVLQKIIHGDEEGGVNNSFNVSVFFMTLSF